MTVHARGQDRSRDISRDGSSDGPAGAPKASNVKEVLVALRDRLEFQLDNEDDHVPEPLRVLRSNIRCQLEQINEALARIEEGKYGVCANCLKQIEAARLVARPYSTLCMACRDRQGRGEVAP